MRREQRPALAKARIFRRRRRFNLPPCHMMESYEHGIQRAHHMSFCSAERGETESREFVLECPNILASKREIMDQIDRAFSIRGMDSRCALVKFAFVPDRRPADFTKPRDQSFERIRACQRRFEFIVHGKKCGAIQVLVRCIARNKKSICATWGGTLARLRIR